jgi:ADP-dependent NAD(P)H-hydrate dehydratase / NAD(P)H-hydrate epimerase
MSNLSQIKNSAVRKLLPQRNLRSHKGNNGRVLIVGGSIDFHGAPILSALGALNSGADLVYLYVPECNFEVTRSMYPDFVVKKYPGEFLTQRSAAQIVNFGKKCGAVLIGPGLGEREETMEGVMEILRELHVPTVLDAEGMMALKRIEKFPLQQTIVITPHQNEFRMLVDRDVEVKPDDAKSIILLRSLSMDLHINVLLKSHFDFVSSYEGNVEINRTGNAGMTVGGSGDVLAGFVTSLMSQGLEGYDAARCAAYLFGAAGDLLFKRKGYAYTASDLAMTLPFVLK